ncbi:MarR family winged helix-turn-helix transcriptional regulator [Maritimibacter sp. UBA3975]|uniref:MarR family winged helix-turn-helix transcriptional regulator n=1 Tax=Maritimibacter sp. UBA3975 TaxID=1946833 RepID=UPI000C0B2C29|nr:MarR family winged helix-turn-helix transcriptional regulator [Maritimibacter sp. UBA3975]MAM60761.1 MarR family transcriptional regulator [Maritimibacter sp.]|tara:strand:+ start:22121 stop:22579 length:459 start_codon:yes stop_codon:yes gene_type:complete
MTDARPDFLDMPGHLIRRMNQVSTALFRERMAEIGLDLTPVQFATLEALAEMPGIDQARLAATIAYDKVTIGGVVDRLVAKLMIDRRPSLTDRRAKALRLTQNGVVLLDRARPQVRILQNEILHGLSYDEQRLLIALMRKSANSRDAANPAG